MGKTLQLYIDVWILIYLNEKHEGMLLDKCKNLIIY